MPSRGDHNRIGYSRKLRAGGLGEKRCVVASAGAGVLPEPGAQIRLDGSLVRVVAATSTPYGADLVIRRGDGTLADVVLTHAELDQGSVPENDGRGDTSKALAGLWARWMQHAIPRIRSAVLATKAAAAIRAPGRGGIHAYAAAAAAAVLAS